MALTLLSCASESDPFADLDLRVLPDLTVATNAPTPDAADFLPRELQEILTERQISVSYGTPLSTSALGQQTVYLTLTAKNGQTRTLTGNYQGIYDNFPPTVTGLCDRSALCGEGVVLRDGVAAVDNCLGEVTLTVDASALDNTKEGVYPIYYTATDAAGNRATFSASVYIYSASVTEDELMQKVDEVISGWNVAQMNREQLCRNIYQYVQETMYYIADTDKSDWVRGAYTALFVSGNGDCFSYFAAAKAFLHRLNIPYIEIRRSEGYTEDTHYWLLVNIAEQGEAARWYYFDTTELRSDGYNHSGCLLTAAQVQAYNRVRPYFYQHDASGLPTVCDTVITPTPELNIGGEAE